MTGARIPGLGLGSGSQPVDEDGAELSYMAMPRGMTTFAAPALPEPEEVNDIGNAMRVLDRVLMLLRGHSDAGDGPHNVVSLKELDKDNLAFVNQALGEGEVAVVDGSNTQAQESVLAGVWRVRSADTDGALVDDVIEVGRFPTLVSDRTFLGAQDVLSLPAVLDEGVFNAPPLVAEINEHVPTVSQGRLRIINLSLLPHTEADLALLDRLLGKGSLTVLSRGYGNCRIMSTNTRGVWWVRFYNSQDTLILNTIEITSLPEVILAAPEDIVDSADRLSQMLEIYR